MFMMTDLLCHLSCPEVDQANLSCMIGHTPHGPSPQLSLSIPLPIGADESTQASFLGAGPSRFGNTMGGLKFNPRLK